MISQETIQQLESIVGREHVSTAEDVVIQNSQDALKQVFPAEAVVFPGTAGEISAIMKLANEKRFFVTARGGGVGYTGGAVPIKGGIVLATGRLNRIIEINKGDLVVVTEPGVMKTEAADAAVLVSFAGTVGSGPRGPDGLPPRHG